jgi:hypothetical protein
MNSVANCWGWESELSAWVSKLAVQHTTSSDSFLRCLLQKNLNVEKGVQPANSINVCIVIYRPSHVIFRWHPTTLSHKNFISKRHADTYWSSHSMLLTIWVWPLLELIQLKSKALSAVLSFAAVCLFYLTCAKQGSHKFSETRMELDYKRYFVTRQVLSSPSVPFNRRAISGVPSTVNFPYCFTETFNNSFLPNGLVTR